MTRNLEIAVDREELRALVADTLERSPAEVTDDADFVGELDLDSLMALEIVVRLEKRYRIRVKDEEFASITSLNGIYDLLTAKLGGT
ncbi:MULTISPECIES: acyl carrier protein [unclassified Frankia]|uniref:acyl carrier protein n=1 Tax=unclassified Frankia TaxID=2632575 RepID=UPI0020249155